jgi:two-component system, cell cycle sensor histidine kinase and response regulator CckA
VRTALLIEDEPLIRALTERALREEGRSVVAAGSAEEALAAAATMEPDIVVTDLSLPGMDGRALIAALRGRWPLLPAVLVSGYTDSGEAADPAIVFLAKPFTLTGLALSVEAALAAVRD